MQLPRRMSVHRSLQRAVERPTWAVPAGQLRWRAALSLGAGGGTELDLRAGRQQSLMLRMAVPAAGGGLLEDLAVTGYAQLIQLARRELILGQRHARRRLRTEIPAC